MHVGCENASLKGAESVAVANRKNCITRSKWNGTEAKSKPHKREKGKNTAGAPSKM